jgi:hypothetical protein
MPVVRRSFDCSSGSSAESGLTQATERLEVMDASSVGSDGRTVVIRLRVDQTRVARLCFWVFLRQASR